MNKKIIFMIGILCLALVGIRCGFSKITSPNIPTSNTIVKKANAIKDKLEGKKIDDLHASFLSDDDWFEVGGKMVFAGNRGDMTSDSTEIAEAWYKYTEEIPADQDFAISSQVKLAQYWDTVTSKNGQVGIGIFLGKAGDEGRLVYEANLCTIARNQRFVQGQMIKNRKGGEPVEVDFKTSNLDSATLEIVYSSKDKSLTLLLDNQLIGSQKIDDSGHVDWQMKDDDAFVFGIMAFSEWVKIESHFPSIEKVTLYQS